MIFSTLSMSLCFPDQFSEEGEDGKVGSSPRKLPKSGETGQRLNFGNIIGHNLLPKLYYTQLLNALYGAIVFFMD